MAEKMRLTELQKLLKEKLDIPQGYPGYSGTPKVDQFHPLGVAEIWYTFGGMLVLIEKFVEKLIKYPRRDSLRHQILDKPWVEYTLEQIKDNREERETWDALVKGILMYEDHPKSYDIVKFILEKGDNTTHTRKISKEALDNLDGFADYDEMESVIGNLKARGLIVEVKGNPSTYYKLGPNIPRFCSEWWWS